MKSRMGRESRVDVLGSLLRRGGVGAACAALLLAAAPVRAEFEGTLEGRVTMSGKGEEGSRVMSTTRTAISKLGTRTEFTGPMGMGGKTVMLVRNDKPDVLYTINDQAKTYSVMDLAAMRQQAAKNPDTAQEQWVIKKLGEETIQGFKTQHVLATQGETAMEMWVAKGLMDPEIYSRMQARQRAAGGANLFKALQDAGADGVPMRTVVATPDGGKVTMDTISVDRTAPAASLFEVPAGYTESKGGIFGMHGQQSDEIKKRMEEAMKNMTPEQREMVEKAMKQRGGGE